MINIKSNPGWYHVHEKFPPFKDNILVCNSDYPECIYICSLLEVDRSSLLEVDRKGDYFVWEHFDGSWDDFEEFNYWMPLPIMDRPKIDAQVTTTDNHDTLFVESLVKGLNEAIEYINGNNAAARSQKISTAEWYDVMNDLIHYDYFKCSKCGCAAWTKTKYCPNCGTLMKNFGE